LTSFTRRASSDELIEAHRVFDVSPPRPLRSPHLQTVLSSRVARGFGSSGRDLIAAAERVTIDCSGGARLVAMVDPPVSAGPLVILLHGWLGNADSPYSRRAAAALHRAGFRVARLIFRDHGDTAGLNAEMFHSARLDEVVDACNALSAGYGNGRTGLLGFSLGGNFALRVASHAATDASIVSVLAVCPVVEPAATVAAIDSGWAGYRWWFLRKWRRALAAKQAAFPRRYDFAEALKLPTIAALTDHVVARYTDFADTESYYAAYRLTNASLAHLRASAHIVAAADDPVIPARDVAGLSTNERLTVTLCRHGGHCAFIDGYRLRSGLDQGVPRFFAGLVSCH
jgi:predicted alpha/beta-fold hydrolase